MGPVEVTSFLIALVGCFVGLAGFLTGRDKKLINDAEWKGSVNAKLDIIIAVQTQVTDHERRITVLERDGKTAYVRIDELRERVQKLEDGKNEN